MKIRSITFQQQYSSVFNSDSYSKVSKVFTDAGYIVRTMRICFSPISTTRFIDECAKGNLIINTASEFDAIKWQCLPIKLNSYDFNASEEFGTAVVQALIQNPSLFINLVMSDKTDSINHEASVAANVLRHISKFNHESLFGFRFGISTVPIINGAYFPFAVAQSENSQSFSIALETTGFIINKLKNHHLHEVQKMITNECKAIGEISGIAGKKNNIQFAGMDISVAPYPEEKLSVVDLYNELGFKLGSAGVVTTTSNITSMLKSSVYDSGSKLVGFNGVMFSPMEDNLLSNCLAEGSINYESLLLYSTQCGCGIDMLAVPAETTMDEYIRLILDVKTISHKLNKPLGVRLMPFKDKVAGEAVFATDEYICDSWVSSI